MSYEGYDEVPYLSLSELLPCGHRVGASEDSGGMDELDRVTMRDVERLLGFKIKAHRCTRSEELYR